MAETVASLIVRASSDTPWIKNFKYLGWKVRDETDSNWIQLHPGNTRIRSSDNTRWLKVK